MTIRQRLTRARYQLLALIGISAIAWAAAVVLAWLVLGLVLVRLQWFPARLPLELIAIGCAAVTLGLLLWRGRYVRSEARFALWVEEQHGGLDHALVTVTESSLGPAEQYPELFRRAAEADVGLQLRTAGLRLIGRPVMALGLAALLIHWLGPLDRLSVLPTLGHAGSDRTIAADPLHDLSVRIESPAYSRRTASTLPLSATVSALVGSHLTFLGSGHARQMTARLGADSLTPVSDQAGWAVAAVMPPEPVVISFGAGNRSRLVALVPILDSVPAVRLRLPASDTTYPAAPHGQLTIEAALSDDIGLASGQVEYLISTGSEEDFQTRAINGRLWQMGGVRSATVRESIAFDTLKLVPGSVLHIRVVAFDHNDLSGPGKGISETRTLRIAEPEDSTEAEAVPPPPIDSMWISQRLLNMKTDSLMQSRRALPTAAMARRSEDYSVIQESLRQHTLTVISEIEGDPDDPTSTTTAVTRRLRQVAELMVTARTHLAAAEPGTALTFMRRILRTLDELRLANRYFIRGHPRPMAVDLARTRLTGTDPAHRGIRTSGNAEFDSAPAWALRLDRVVELGRRNPDQARDSLTVLRVEAARSAPTVATAIGLAVERIGRGVALDSALAPVRRALNPNGRLETGAPDWAPVP